MLAKFSCSTVKIFLQNIPLKKEWRKINSQSLRAELFYTSLVKFTHKAKSMAEMNVWGLYLVHGISISNQNISLPNCLYSTQSSLILKEICHFFHLSSFYSFYISWSILVKGSDSINVKLDIILCLWSLRLWFWIF